MLEGFSFGKEGRLDPEINWIDLAKLQYFTNLDFPEIAGALPS